MAQTAQRLTNPKDGATAKLRAAGDKRREEHLKGRNIAKRDEAMLPTSAFAGSDKPAGKVISTQVLRTAKTSVCQLAKPTNLK